MSKKEVEYIIVGQGLAGSILAWFLLKENKSFIIIDDLKGETSSTKASGLINPITGRRFVKSWLSEELMSFAKETYLEIEQKLNCSLFKETKIHRILQTVEQQNDWASKVEDERFKDYLGQKELVHYDKSIIKNDLACIEIAPVYKIDTPILIESLSNYFTEKDLILREKFEHSLLDVNETEVEYKDIKAKKIIFCEGFNMVYNPFFKNVPLFLSKGEVLHFEAKDLPQDYILGGNTNIIPLGNHTFSVGATYGWGDTSPEPTQAKKEELIEKLEAIINCKYKLLEHNAGIRPTVKDRRPVIGAHPDYKNVLVFNGLGTKGLSLSPYFAQQFVAWLCGKEALNEEVLVERFWWRGFFKENFIVL